VTLIVATADRKGNVCLGADAITVSEGRNARRAVDPKIFRNGEYLLGSTGPIIMSNALDMMEAPSVDGEIDLRRFMITKFVPHVRSVMKDLGVEITKPDEGLLLTGRVLICVRGHIFEMDSGYAITEARYQFNAIGCADNEAHAAMFAALKLKRDLSARQLAKIGLEAGSEFDLAIRPPFTFLTAQRR
jgi:ATP-dependent protease HslVU (ClpYQ) peptidase subunit